MTIDFARLQGMSNDDLAQHAESLGLVASNRRRDHLIFQIAQDAAKRDNVNLGQGVLEVHGEGFGFLRSAEDNFLPGSNDIYVSQSQIRRFNLQTGDTVIGIVRSPKEGERYPALLRVETVNSEPPGGQTESFTGLSPIYPDDRVGLSSSPVLRAIDLVAPIGLGQRGILVGPTRTGRTAILRELVDTFAADDELDVTVLLVGERPEEIREWRAATTAEVIATPFEESAARHMQVTDIVFERARRMVERGDDVVLIIESLSRMLRFSLADLPGSGREIRGVDASSLHRIRRYMASARALEEGGSLTIIGVVSGDPGNRTDRVLLEDLQEVVNWELVLDRHLADRGLHPPVHVSQSGTRREERLLEADEITERRTLRAAWTGDPVQDASLLVSAATSRPGSLDNTAESGQ